MSSLDIQKEGVRESDNPFTDNIRSELEKELLDKDAENANLEEQLIKLKTSNKMKFEKHAHGISIFTMYATISLFSVLIIVLIVYTIRASFVEHISIDTKWYNILLAFLSGALGAGLGDSIFKRIKQYWDS